MTFVVNISHFVDYVLATAVTLSNLVVAYGYLILHTTTRRSARLSF